MRETLTASAADPAAPPAAGGQPLPQPTPPGADSHDIAVVATSTAAFVGSLPSGPTDTPVRVRNMGDVERTFGGLRADGEVAYALRQFYANGGVEAWVVRVAAPDAAALAGDPEDQTGIHALTDTDFNVLCVPDTVQLGDADAAQVATAATALCESRRAVYLLDVPQADAGRDGPAGLVAWLDQNAALRHPNVALYAPRPLVLDRLGGPPRAVASSGTVAGVYARTDAAHGVWKAPAGAGATLRDIEGLAYALTNAESGSINALGVNALRSFPARGAVVWGARTLAGADALASEWKYVPVRRLALLIEDSVDRGTRWAASEPTGEPLWEEIRLRVGAFLDDLFRRGAFQGTTPKEAYLVMCGRETTTPADVDRGLVSVLVGFAPLRSAEFVFLKIQQAVGGPDAGESTPPVPSHAPVQRQSLPVRPVQELKISRQVRRPPRGRH